MKGVLSRLPMVQRGEVPAELAELAETIRRSSPKVDLRAVVRAFEYARTAHDGQFRSSGEPYITHPVAVAAELAELGLDTDTLVAALLHDVVEDTPASRDEIETYFGSQVAALVDGVTKLDRLQVDSKQEQQAETLRKMILAMADDIRVLLIKLADRLHNVETLEHLRRDKQQRIAQETLDIYAPLAHRLGIQRFKLRLEDASFRALHPKRYESIVEMVQERQPEREAYIEEVAAEIREKLREVRVRADVHGRPKHYYSIYEKMLHKEREFEEIYDLVGFRIIVGDVRDCYAVLGQIHAAWRPIPGRFKDFIAMPKFNLYQSLHTSVIGPKGRPLEIQIRTRSMHHTAEYGVAAHWKYKEVGRSGNELQWVEQMVEWQRDVTDPRAYLDALKLDLYQDEVFVFTPAGEAKALPAGSTPIDLAYAVHTEVGHRCIGARVNTRLVPLEYRLQNGDTVEILTSKAEDAGPSRDWLQIAVSQRARSKIRAYFNRERREDAEERGREAIQRALRKKGLNYARVAGAGEIAAVAVELSYRDVASLHRAVGENHLNATTVAQAVAQRLDTTDEPAEPELLTAGPAPIQIGPRGTDGVAVAGDDDMLVKLARCCTPVPGDRIVGFVTRGRGVSVHREDCSNVGDLRRDPERFVSVSWSGEASATFLVSVQVEAFDRKHLLRDITAVLGDLHVNIMSAQVTTRRDRVAILRFSFELADPTHLDEVMRSVRRVDAVIDAYRVVPGANGRG